jgi:hypothetical protein
MIPVGTKVKSLRSDKQLGTVVGYGMLEWPATIEGPSGDDGPQAVYLVKCAIGSSTLGPACIVMRVDQTEMMKVEE